MRTRSALVVSVLCSLSLLVLGVAYVRSHHLLRGLIPIDSVLPEASDEAPINPVEIRFSPGPAVESKLPLRLIGTLVLKDSRQSIGAIWSEKREESFPLRPDDLLLPLIQMKKIEGTRAEFVNIAEKRLEFLYLKPAYIRKAANSKSLESIGKEDTRPISVNRKDLVACVQGGRCLQDARALPYFVEGKLIGWKLMQIRDGSIFTRLGFKNEDVILSANGEALTDMGRIPFWLMEIVQVKSLDLGLLREGRVTRIDYQVKD